MKFTYIVLFIVSQFFPAGALAQIDEYSHYRTRYVLKKCLFDTPYSGISGINILDNKEGFWRASYTYPLEQTYVIDGYYTVGHVEIELICATGASPVIMSSLNGGHWNNGSWVSSPDSKTWGQEYRTRLIRLTGENWKGVLFVRIFKEKPNTPRKIFSLCIHENEGEQSLCGNGISLLKNDADLDRIIKAMKEITFAPMSAPKIPAPSFDCTKASTETEKTICVDDILSGMDSMVVTNYLQLKSAKLGANAAKLVVDQRAWLKQRNLCKEDSDCLHESYMQRIDELCKNYPVVSSVQPICVRSIYHEEGDVYN
jgi:uncharacterized protein YecT (DUF1311 family)